VHQIKIISKPFLNSGRAFFMVYAPSLPLSRIKIHEDPSETYGGSPVFYFKIYCILRLLKDFWEGNVI